jgi:glycosyltransferase involved in cell wall biosynthesis
MKIAFLLTQSLESPSGLGRYGPLARGLAKLGHLVEIYALHPDYGSLSQRQFETEGVYIRYVAPMHVTKRGNLKEYYAAYRLLPLAAQAAWRLSRAAANSPAEIIHIAKPHPMNSLAGLAARYLRGKKIYLDCDDYEAGSGRFGTGWQKAGVAAFEKWMPRRVKAVTTNTLYMRARLLAWNVAPERLFYLPNGVERDRFAPPDPRRAGELRAALALEGKKVVAFIGSLSLPSHPVDLLLEAFSRLRRSEPEAVLLLAGGGEDYNRLRQLAADLGLSPAVRFCGRVAPEQVPLYYALADVSVDPVYDDEAARGRSPLKLFESWACGVPFVTAGVGDRPTLLGDPPAGLLARPGDPDSLAETILQVLSGPVLAETLRQNGQTRVQNYFWDQLARSLEAVYLDPG